MSNTHHQKDDPTFTSRIVFFRVVMHRGKAHLQGACMAVNNHCLSKSERKSPHFREKCMQHCLYFAEAERISYFCLYKVRTTPYNKDKWLLFGIFFRRKSSDENKK